MTDGRPVDLEAVVRRCAAATEPPWVADKVGTEFRVLAPDAGEPICAIVKWSPGADEADALFIAHARADVPALVAENRRLREALAPFAAIADHHERAGYAASRREDRRDVLHGFHLVPGETVELRLSDCKRAKEVLP